MNGIPRSGTLWHGIWFSWDSLAVSPLHCEMLSVSEMLTVVVSDDCDSCSWSCWIWVCWFRIICNSWFYIPMVSKRRLSEKDSNTTSASCCCSISCNSPGERWALRIGKEPSDRRCSEVDGRLREELRSFMTTAGGVNWWTRELSVNSWWMMK